MAKKRIVILGAGLAGLSAAWHLQKSGIDCHIFEKESEVGGLCRSKNIDGFIFDYDGHILHFRHRYTFDFIKRLLEDNLVAHKRSAWIYSYARYTRYPFQANLYGLPPGVVKECLLGLVGKPQNGRLQNKKDLNFLEWINRTFGKGIAKHFMVPYNTKFWTVAPEGLNCAWLDGFVPVPSLSQIIEGTVEDSQRQFGYNSRFWYPKKGGIACISAGLARDIRNIHLGCRITEIDMVKKEIRTSSQDKEKFDYLISTIPLPELPCLIKGMPRKIYTFFKKLRWNSIFNVNLGIEKKDNRRLHWIYFPQKETCFFRVGFFHNFSSSLTPAGKSSIYVEISYSQDKPLDKKNILSCIKKDLINTDILNANDKISIIDINDIKYGYPIYDTYYTQARENILKYLKPKNIIPCGRYGSWRYFSMEDAILDGRRVANIL